MKICRLFAVSGNALRSIYVLFFCISQANFYLLKFASPGKNIWWHYLEFRLTTSNLFIFLVFEQFCMQPFCFGKQWGFVCFCHTSCKNKKSADHTRLSLENYSCATSSGWMRQFSALLTRAQQSHPNNDEVCSGRMSSRTENGVWRWLEVRKKGLLFCLFQSGEQLNVKSFKRNQCDRLRSNVSRWWPVVGNDPSNRYLYVILYYKGVVMSAWCGTVC